VGLARDAGKHARAIMGAKCFRILDGEGRTVAEELIAEPGPNS
jgi:hypothetical protein